MESEAEDCISIHSSSSEAAKAPSRKAPPTVIDLTNDAPSYVITPKRKSSPSTTLKRKLSATVTPEKKKSTRKKRKAALFSSSPEFMIEASPNQRLSFEVLGKPLPKKRFMLSKHMHVYNATRDSEKEFAQVVLDTFQERTGQEMLKFESKTPLAVDMTFYFPTNDRDILNAPDVDNLAIFVLHALRNVAFAKKQIVSLKARKRLCPSRGENSPRSVISVSSSSSVSVGNKRAASVDNSKRAAKPLPKVFDLLDEEKLPPQSTTYTSEQERKRATAKADADKTKKRGKKMQFFSDTQCHYEATPDRLSFAVLGKPLPKMAPKLKMTRNSKYYNPSQDAEREFAKVVVDAFKASTGLDMPRFDAKAQLEVDTTFFFPNQSDILGTAHDVDNLAKFVLDAFNKVAFRDDKQVVSLSARKMLDHVVGSPGRTLVTIVRHRVQYE
jgi:Holliday junction resolvase RusA-like endonuclease